MRFHKRVKGKFVGSQFATESMSRDKTKTPILSEVSDNDLIKRIKEIPEPQLDDSHPTEFYDEKLEEDLIEESSEKINSIIGYIPYLSTNAVVAFLKRINDRESLMRSKLMAKNQNIMTLWVAMITEYERRKQTQFVVVDESKVLGESIKKYTEHLSVFHWFVYCYLPVCHKTTLAESWNFHFPSFNENQYEEFQMASEINSKILYIAEVLRKANDPYISWASTKPNQGQEEDNMDSTMSPADIENTKDMVGVILKEHFELLRDMMLTTFGLTTIYNDKAGIDLDLIIKDASVFFYLMDLRVIALKAFETQSKTVWTERLRAIMTELNTCTTERKKRVAKLQEYEQELEETKLLLEKNMEELKDEVGYVNSTAGLSIHDDIQENTKVVETLVQKTINNMEKLEESELSAIANTMMNSTPLPPPPPPPKLFTREQSKVQEQIIIADTMLTQITEQPFSNSLEDLIKNAKLKNAKDRILATKPNTTDDIENALKRKIEQRKTRDSDAEDDEQDWDDEYEMQMTQGSYKPKEMSYSRSKIACNTCGTNNEFRKNGVSLTGAQLKICVGSCFNTGYKTFYCSSRCQNNDWTSHKKICKSLTFSQ